MPRKRRLSSTEAQLQGPVPSTAPAPLPDLGLHPAKAAVVHQEVRRLAFRWKPLAETPNGLIADLYWLLAYMRDGDPIACPTLSDAPITRIHAAE